MRDTPRKISRSSENQVLAGVRWAVGRDSHAVVGENVFESSRAAGNRLYCWHCELSSIQRIQATASHTEQASLAETSHNCTRPTTGALCRMHTLSLAFD